MNCATAGVGAFVRIQPLFEGTPAEIEAAVTEGLTAIVPPKVATPDEVRRLHDLLSYAEGRAGILHGSVGLLPLPETAQGMYDAYHLAKASPRVRGIHGAVSGPVAGDFARAFGFRATSGARSNSTSLRSWCWTAERRGRCIRWRAFSGPRRTI